MTSLTKANLFSANRAIYLPAISSTFARFAHSGNFARSLPVSASDLDFLSPSNPLFAYPFALYSAGQDIPSATGTPPPNMVSKRNRTSTIVLGDSGGYQVQGNKIKFRGDTTTRRMMRWMEEIADWSMVLDFPLGGISSGNMKRHSDRLVDEGRDLKALSVANGQSIDFNACLLQTQFNNDLFVKERSHGATRFLNVLQGRNEAESSTWFQAVKCYPFEGWAFAGAHQNRFSLVVARILDLWDEGILENLEWLHFLGTATLEIGCLLTSLQRAVRQHVNPKLQISFDSASPFISAGKNQMIVGHTVDDREWSTHTVNVSEGSAFDLSKTVAEVCATEIGAMDATSFGVRHACSNELDKLVRMSDICAGSAGTSDIDGDASKLLMHHNAEAMVRAHEDAHRAFYSRRQLTVPFLTKVVSTTTDLILKEYAAPGCRGGPYPKLDEWRHELDRLAM